MLNNFKNQKKEELQQDKKVNSNSARQKKLDVWLVTFFVVIFVGFFIFVTFFVGFNIYLYLLCLFFAALFIFQNPEAGLYSIIILTFIFERFFTLQPIVFGENVYKIYPLDVLLGLTILSFFVAKLREKFFLKTLASTKNSREKKFFISPLGILILIFICFSVFSAIYGVTKGGTFSLAFSTFKNYALYSVFFFLVINLVTTKEKLKRLALVFLVGGVFLLFFVILGWVKRRGLWIEYTPLSTIGTRLLAPTHAFYLALSSLFLLNLYAFKKKIFYPFTSLILLIQLLGILGSLARHLYLAEIVALGVSFLFLPREYKKNLAKMVFTQGLIIIILLAVLSWTSYLVYGEVPILGAGVIKSTVARIKTLSLAPEDQSAYFRLFAWQEAWQRFLQSPIFGIGFGHKLVFDVFGWPTYIEVRELHNDFVGIGLQMGLLGFVLFLALNLYFLILLLKNLKNINEDLKPYLIGILACFVLFIFAANFGTYFDINLLVIFYWIILGMGIALLKIEGNF